MGNAEDEDLASLRAISDASGGRFLTAGSAQELKEALTSAVGTSFRLRRGDTVVGEGNLGADEVLRVPAGEYSLQLDSAPPRELALTLESEVKHTVVFRRDKQGVAHTEWQLRSTEDEYELEPFKVSGDSINDSGTTTPITSAKYIPCQSISTKRLPRYIWRNSA